MRNLLILGLLAFACSEARADEPKLHGNIDAARAIVKADRDFGDLVKHEGTAKAFRDSMDALDGVIYAGGSTPAIGSNAIYKEMGGDAPDDSVLEWQPQEVFAAVAGDMGVSRGRWTATPKSAVAKPASGSYVTVWRKNGKGVYKGLVDIGNADKAH